MQVCVSVAQQSMQLCVSVCGSVFSEGVCRTGVSVCVSVCSVREWCHCRLCSVERPVDSPPAERGQSPAPSLPHCLCRVIAREKPSLKRAGDHV